MSENHRQFQGVKKCNIRLKWAKSTVEWFCGLRRKHETRLRNVYQLDRDIFEMYQDIFCAIVLLDFNAFQYFIKIDGE